MIEWFVLGFCVAIFLFGLGMVTLIIPAQWHPCTIPFGNLSDNQLWQFTGAPVLIMGFLGIVGCAIKKWHI